MLHAIVQRLEATVSARPPAAHKWYVALGVRPLVGSRCSWSCERRPGVGVRGKMSLKERPSGRTEHALLLERLPKRICSGTYLISISSYMPRCTNGLFSAPIARKREKQKIFRGEQTSVMVVWFFFRKLLPSKATEIFLEIVQKWTLSL